MMMIPSGDLPALKRRHSLAAVMAAHGVVLRPAGIGRLTGRCPFHDDRRPSLLVDERDGHFYCFGCRARGDVIDYLMRHAGLDFWGAIARLEGSPARSRPVSPVPARREQRWDRLTLEEQVLMNTAAAVYQDRLWHTPLALAYVRARGLPDWLIRRQGLGYSDGHSLDASLRWHGGLRLAHGLGLLDPAGRERLAQRVVIPAFRGGLCCWFIGRVLDEGDQRPRYLALAGERPVLGQEQVAGRREAFVCEGIFDYLTALAWRLPACCLCGTAAPVDRLGFLARARQVYGVFDGDAAGRAAAERFRSLLGERARIVALPDGLDLNDLGRRDDGRRTFFAFLSTARHAGQKGVGDGTSV